MTLLASSVWRMRADANSALDCSPRFLMKSPRTLPKPEWTRTRSLFPAPLMVVLFGVGIQAALQGVRTGGQPVRPAPS